MNDYYLFNGLLASNVALLFAVDLLDDVIEILDIGKAPPTSQDRWIIGILQKVRNDVCWLSYNT